MHNIYINSAGEAALKKGGPYPNKTMFVTDLHEFTVSDGSYVEGARKALAVMLKDSKKYASTGGWGFQPPLGTPSHASGGEISSPSQVYLAGM